MGKSPQLVAAEHALGNIDIERVPWHTADWLAAGHDGSALHELAGLDHTEPQRIRELLPIALDEISAPVPTRADAAQAWLARLARTLLDGDIDEWTTAAETSAFLSWNFDLDEVWRTPMAALHVLVDEWTRAGNAATTSSPSQSGSCAPTRYAIRETADEQSVPQVVDDPVPRPAVDGPSLRRGVPGPVSAL